MGDWTTFFLAQVVAAAALAGLLFVGASFNLTKLLSLGGLPSRALQALLLLIAIVVVSSLMLMPGQSIMTRGIEILSVGCVTLIVGTGLGVRGLRQSEAQYRIVSLWNIFLFEAAVLPFLAGGALVVLGRNAGFYWVAGAICFSLVKAMTDAWILLVEINR